MAHGGGIVRLTLIDEYLKQQREPTAVERFAQKHGELASASGVYRDLIPAAKPGAGEQYAFQVDLDRCTSCKACVTACHSMNGLDEDETWRFVGHLHGGTIHAPVQQAVTTACHHCVDPACLSGCPVQAYDKDPVTGIVKHLDDQCIGCQYCTLTCPYEVPQYSERKGIVRKCDMCSDRLAAGEAPACVQACPNEAISIQIRTREAILEDAVGEPFLPAAPSPGITAPATTFKSARAMPRNTLPVDYHSPRAAHRHMPLVVMLVLTQLSVGAFVLEQLLRLALPSAVAAIWSPPATLSALGLGLLALAASVLHLGRPLYAFRALLGLRTSWMSREILAFGVFAKVAIAYTALTWRDAFGVVVLPEAVAEPAELVAGGLVALSGIAGVVCSVMIYHVTRKRFWHATDTAAKFFGTATVLGAALTLFVGVAACARARDLIAPYAADVQAAFGAVAILIVLATLAKLGSELSIVRSRSHEDLKRTAALLTNELRVTFRLRIALALLGGVALPVVCLSVILTIGLGALLTTVAAAALIALTLGELLERTIFFAAVSAPRMPGGLR